jgi:methylenetetrahydrofolate dehydrogenase (NADP+) / methenyltetrahydrofolate cyclohydrolase
MKILDGEKISNKLMVSYKEIIKKNKIRLKIVVILVGTNFSSKIYVNIKKKKCKEMGISCEIRTFDKNISQKKLLEEIKSLNNDKLVDAIMVQLPLPNHIITRTILDAVLVEKDVEGLSSYYMGQLLIGNEEIIPCTPKGILRLLEEYKITLEGKKVCMIGYSDIVGKPLGVLCLNRGATVTHCHIKTKQLREHTLNADILMTSTGVAGLIKKDMVKMGCIIIDIGITRMGKKIVGDVNFNDVKDKCSYITPVPGGVGPMTVAMLIENIIEIKEKNTIK